MTVTVHKQYVQVAERRVFLRYAGQGPVVVLLHQSPESSVSLLPWFDRLAGRFSVLAPDTPGFGRSDPLPRAQPTIPDFAAALAGLLDALGLRRVLLYGVHTGAAIAARLARDRPERVAALVCDGLSAFNADERLRFLDGYLPPFEPSWDGSHLAWLWARLREQTIFFPWHDRSAAARMVYPLADTAATHKSVMELLDAGDGYRVGYRAPFLYTHGAAGAAQLQVPARLLYRRADPLRAHLDRLPAMPPCVQAREVADAQALAQSLADHFSQHEGMADEADSSSCVAQALSATRRLLDTPLGPLSLHLAGRLDSGRLELTLPDIGTPAEAPLDGSPGVLAAALDLPGHGDSQPWTLDAVASGRWLQAVADALAPLAPRGLWLRGHGGSAAFAARLALMLGPRCHGLSLVDPLWLDEAQQQHLLAGLPDATPSDTGAHLLAAWNRARLGQLFWPWRPSGPDAMASRGAPPPMQVHQRALELLRAGALVPALWRSALQHEPWSALAATALRVGIAGSPHDELQRQAARVAQAAGLQACAVQNRSAEPAWQRGSRDAGPQQAAADGA